MLLFLAWWFTLYDHIRNLYDLKKENQSRDPEIKEETPTKQSNEFSYEDVLTKDSSDVTLSVFPNLNNESNHLEKLSDEEITSFPSKNENRESLHCKNTNDRTTKERIAEEIFEKVLSEVEFSPAFLDSDVPSNDVVLLTDASLNYASDINIPHGSNLNQDDEIAFQTEEGIQDKKKIVDTPLFIDGTIQLGEHKVDKKKSIGFIRSKKRSVIETDEIIVSNEVQEQENEQEAIFENDFDENANEEEISVNLQKHSEFKLKNQPVGHIYSIISKDKPKSPSKFKVSVHNGHKKPTMVVSQHHPNTKVLPDLLSPVSRVYQNTDNLSSASTVYQVTDNLSPASPVYQTKILPNHDQSVDFKQSELNIKDTLDQSDELVHLYVHMKGQKTNIRLHDNAQHENVLHENGDKTSFHVNKGNRQKIEIELHFGSQDLIVEEIPSIRPTENSKTDDNLLKINGIE